MIKANDGELRELKDKVDALKAALQELEDEDFRLKNAKKEQRKERKEKDLAIEEMAEQDAQLLNHARADRRRARRFSRKRRLHCGDSRQQRDRRGAARRAMRTIADGRASKAMRESATRAAIGCAPERRQPPTCASCSREAREAARGAAHCSSARAPTLELENGAESERRRRRLRAGTACTREQTPPRPAAECGRRGGPATRGERSSEQSMAVVDARAVRERGGAPPAAPRRSTGAGAQVPTADAAGDDAHEGSSAARTRCAERRRAARATAWRVERLPPRRASPSAAMRARHGGRPANPQKPHRRIRSCARTRRRGGLRRAVRRGASAASGRTRTRGLRGELRRGVDAHSRAPSKTSPRRAARRRDERVADQIR